MSRTVYVDVYNRIAKILRPYPEEDLLKYWSYSVPGFRYMMHRYPGWDGRKKLLSRDKVSSSLFYATRREIENELGIRFKVRKMFEGMPRLHSKRQITSVGKYEFQNDCLDAMLDKGFRYGGGLILNATATGKTRTAAMYFAQTMDYGLFIVDQLDLLEQAKAEIEEHLLDGERVGYVGNSKFKPKRITVATIQTLSKHRNDIKFIKWTRQIRSTMIDELHVQMGKRNFDVVTKINAPVSFGLTATLSMGRKDVRLRAYAICGPTLFEYPVRKGMSTGVLSHGSVIRIVFPNDTRLFSMP